MKKNLNLLVDILLLMITLTALITLDDFFYPSSPKETAGKLNMSRWEQNMNGWMLQSAATFGSHNESISGPAPQKIDQLILEGLILKKSERFEGAISSSNQAIALDSTDARGYFLRAQLLELQSNEHLALGDYSKTIALNPKVFQAYLCRGALLIQSNQLFPGLSDFLHALWINPLKSLSFLLVYAVNQLF